MINQKICTLIEFHYFSGGAIRDDGLDLCDEGSPFLNLFVSLERSGYEKYRVRLMKQIAKLSNFVG